MARPEVPWSPGAVHRRRTVGVPAAVALRSVTRAGGVVSGGGGDWVVASGTFERGDQFGTSSAVFRAHQYRVAGARPVTLIDSRVPAGPGGADVTRVARGKFEAFSGP